MIRFFDLQKINQQYQEQFQKKMELVLDKGWFILGDEVRAFESNFADYCGSGHCIGVGNGLDALVLIFKGYIQLGKLQKGDEVIGVAAGFPTTVNPILQFGAIPVFVDIDPQTHNIDVSKIEAAISPKTKAIMLAHSLGNPFNLDVVTALCKKYNLC